MNMREKVGEQSLKWGEQLTGVRAYFGGKTNWQSLDV
jgi:hypothetical protein